jgi:hypothetical protein
VARKPTSNAKRSSTRYAKKIAAILRSQFRLFASLQIIESSGNSARRQNRGMETPIYDVRHGQNVSITQSYDIQL